jgi:hypothetical protein
MNKRDYELDASLYYSEEIGYSLYVLSNHSTQSSCVAALHIKDFQSFIKNLEIFLRRDNFGILDEKIDREFIDVYNNGWRDPEFVPGFIEGIPGAEFGQVINNAISIYPAHLPVCERAFWSDLFMRNHQVTLSRIGFKI